MKPEQVELFTPHNVAFGLFVAVAFFVGLLERRHRRRKRVRYVPAQGPRRVPQHMRELVWRRDGPNCYLCGGRKGPVHLSCHERHLLFFTTRHKCDRCYQVDHVHPYSKGGVTHPSNLRVAHAGCNRRKSDRVLVRRR